MFLAMSWSLDVTLTNRLTLFFALTLFMVLGGFSSALYLLARTHLSRQLQTRLDSALDTLVAAAELKSDVVEWEPAERRLDFSIDVPNDRLIWQVADLQGKVIARSASMQAKESLNDLAINRDAGDWRIGRREIRPLIGAPPSKLPGDPGDRAENLHSGLNVTVALALAPMQATLTTLALTLTAASLAVFLLSLLATRWVCRRGLAPLRKMAQKARSMDSADLSERLPMHRTRDELEDLAGSFNGLLNRLQESFERQRRFTGDASHQLRTPLAAVLGQIEVAQRRDRSAEEYRQTLQSVHAQAAQLHRIVEALLFLARADSDAHLPSAERIDVSSWLNECLESWKMHSRYKDFRTYVGGDLGHVWGQPVLLGELLNILLDNACRYSPPGTLIHLRAERNGTGVHLDVTDHGPGIAAADAPQVFSPFFRSQNGRTTNQEGSGLGLSIAARLARAMRGSLSVSTAPGEGSTFSVVLPGDVSK
jgi:heavy metal sensor kinase